MKKNYVRNWLFKFKSTVLLGSLLLSGFAVNAQLNGTYTIDAGSAKSTSNFTNFEQVADTLNDEGVSGPVIINVIPKTGGYEEVLELGRVSGTSSTNTITFNGNKALLWESGNFIVRLNGTKFVTIDNLIMENEAVSPSTMVVLFGPAAEDNTINNCELIISKYNTSTTSNYNTSAYIASSTGTLMGSSASWVATRANVITNNKMWNGSSSSTKGPILGVNLMGGNPANGWGHATDWIVSDNDIQDVYFSEIYNQYAQGTIITGNKLHDNRSSSTTHYSFYSTYSTHSANQNYEITGNEIYNINLSGNGVLFGVYEYQNYGTQGNRLIINDNIIRDNKSGGYTYAWYSSGQNLAAGNDRYKDYIGNKIYNNTSGTSNDNFAGMLHYYNENTNYYNNLYYNNRGSNQEWGIRVLNSNKKLNIVNNTLHLNNGARNGVFACILQPNREIVDVNIKNNILHTSTDASIFETQMYVTSAEASNVNFGSNVYFSNTDSIELRLDGTYYDNLNGLDAWRTASGDMSSRLANPQFKDTLAGDYTPTNPGIANMGEPGYVTDDIDGDTRTACGPDPGVQEFFTDLIASNVSYITTTCGNTAPTLTVDITNPYGVDLTNFPVGYILNSDPLVTELVTDTVKANSTKTITFVNPPMLNTPGANTIEVGLGCDDNDANNTETINFTVLPVPSGGELVEGTNFEGYFRGGTEMNPDVTVFGYPSEYDITRPTQSTYAASGAPGTDYTYALSATTAGGVDVTTSGFSLINSDETILADPATSLTDSLVWIQLTATSVAGNCDTMFGRWMYVPHTPDVSFDAENVCLGDVSEFLNTSTLEGNDYMLNTWEFDDPDASVTDDNADIQDGFYSYTTFGTAEVVLTVWNGVYPKFKYSDTANITITPKPLLDYKVLNACEGSDVEFVNSSTLPVPGTITYEWDFNGEGSSTDKSPKFTFTTPGQRVVTLKGTANGCVAELDKNAYQFENPVANFSSTGACNFVDVDFLNTSTIPNEAGMGFAWDFGDGGISRLSDPAHAFATPGSKTVKLTATSEFGCVDEYTGSITLNESPEADFEWDAACNLTPVQFTRTGSVPNGGANSSYTWDFAGLGASGQENPNFLFSDIGPKAVMLTVSDLNGCSSSITKELSVVLQAVADFNVADVCEGDDAVFTNKSTVSAGNLDYVWSFGDPDVTTSTDLSPRFAYPESGTTQIINVTLQANVPGGCSDEITKSLTVNAKPDASFTADVQGRTVVIDGPSGNDIYQWRFGEGGSDNAEDPTYTYNNVDAGTFEICLATKNAECWNESCETVVVNLVGVAELTLNNEMINVYPNPSSGNFNLVVSNASEDVVIKVADLLGNEISIAVTDNLNGVYAINLDAVADGVYFVQVKNGDYYATKRITVAK